MDNVRFIKSFSKGQITIPKEIRDSLLLGDDFWLKVFVDKDRIVAEPISSQSDRKTYHKALSKVKGSWFSSEEYNKNRQDAEDRLKKGKSHE